MFLSDIETLGKTLDVGVIDTAFSITDSLKDLGIDPSIAWAAGPHIYVAAMGLARNPGEGDWGGARVLRSDDCGATWVEESLIPGKLTGLFDPDQEGQPVACDEEKFKAADGCKKAQVNYSLSYKCWCDVTPDMLQLFVDPYDYSQWAIADFRTNMNNAHRTGWAGRSAAYTYRTCTSNCAESPTYGDWSPVGAFVDGPGGGDGMHPRILGRVPVSVPRGQHRGAASGGALAIVGVDEDSKYKKRISLYLTLNKGTTVFSRVISDQGFEYNDWADSMPLNRGMGMEMRIGAALGAPDADGHPTLLVAWSIFNDTERKKCDWDKGCDRSAALVVRRVHIDMSDPQNVTFKLGPQKLFPPESGKGENQILFVDVIGSDPRYTPSGVRYPYASLVSLVRTIPADRPNTKLRWKYLSLTGESDYEQAVERQAPIADWIPNGTIGEYYTGTSFVGTGSVEDEPALRFFAVQPWSNKAHFPASWDCASRTSLKYLRVYGPSPEDHCGNLKGKRILLDANGHAGSTTPREGLKLVSGSDGVYGFETELHMRNEPADPVTGSCRRSRIRFTRTRAGVVFEQIFTGWILDGGKTMSGTFTHNGTGTWPWSGSVRLPQIGTGTTITLPASKRIDPRLK